MSKLNCINCKYYDFNACDGVDWCKLNHEETGICGNCDREFEDLEEATTHYDAIVEENNTFLIENSKMAGEIKNLQHKLEVAEKALNEMSNYAINDNDLYDLVSDFNIENEKYDEDHFGIDTCDIVDYFKEQAEKEVKGEK